jgi:hypothetical protein
MTTAEFFKRTVIVLCVALVPLAVIAFIAIEKLYVRDSPWRSDRASGG